MRIISGRLGGRVIKGPSGDGIRPTSDRMRESLFNILAHGLNFPIEGARVLDLFAGTGALSCEALSRGANFAVLVDIGAEARGLQRENIEALGLGGVTRILRRDATKLGPVAPFEPFDIAFCDPPYGKGLGEAALQSALTGGWLRPQALIVLEERASAGIVLPAGLTEIERRKAGETQLVFGRLSEIGI
jgi:16S rRNA (guanine966-N2)-methyltransferase